MNRQDEIRFLLRRKRDLAEEIANARRYGLGTAYLEFRKQYEDVTDDLRRLARRDD